MYRRLFAISILMLLLLSLATAVFARPRFALAYWREMGAFENAGCLYMRIWVMRYDGTPMGNISIMDQSGAVVGITPSNGRVDVPFDDYRVNQPLQIKVRDYKGYDSDLTPVMSTKRYPSWGTYSYEMCFILKSDENTAGVYDTNTYGTVNLPGETAYDAPYTKSLAFNSINPLNRMSDEFATTTWADSHSQSFVADGDRVRAVLLQGVLGGTSNLSFKVDICNGGPNGTVIASATTPDHSGVDPWLVTFAENACPVTNGQTYWVRMSRSGGLGVYATIADVYPNGTYYANSYPVTVQDIKGLVCCEKATSATTGTISGYVRDANGTAISGAYVFVANSYRKTTSAADGSYSLTGLLPGTYNLNVIKPGCTLQNSGDVTVSANQTITVSFKLYPLSANLINNSGFESGALPSWLKTSLFGGVYANPYLGTPSHSGSYWAGKAVQNSASMGGRAYQIVNVIPGAEYTATVWVRTDSYTTLRTYEYPDNCKGRIGLDLAGSTTYTNPKAWSPWTISHNAWTPISVTARATGTTMSVWLDYTMMLPEDYNIVGFDDVYLGSANTSGKIASISKMADGMHVGVFGQISTTSTDDMSGALYAEESDRTDAIKIQTDQTIARGQIISATGTLKTINGEKVIVADSAGTMGPGVMPKPLGMRPGQIASQMIDNTCILIRTWGEVVSTGSGYVVISDGDGWVKVYTSKSLSVGQFVRVTGVISTELNGGQIVPVVKCRDTQDVI